MTDGHWQNLLTAMGREDLKDDPRFTSNAARVENMAATEALVTAWTIGLATAEVAAAAKRHKVPAAPVRNAVEVMNDPHMHERGMLQRIEHPSLGSIVVPNSPLRLHGSDRIEPVPSAVARATQPGDLWRTGWASGRTGWNNSSGTA